ncbi:MAG TPA: NAD(P)/FAD-dependent oxidoreductase [Solirubrobacterales bacterium]|nr:NAD(P)/FAD-dependent oxidoreductase [Solirubrobacterales bacterium]
MAERADVAVVGARVAGSAAAIAFARAGLRVVALDRVTFPADTISTHLLWPAGLAELKRLGVLERVEAVGAPRMPVATTEGCGHLVRGDFSPVEGVDYAMCVRRPGLDAALVAGAREAGAEVRERVRVTDLVRDGGRVAGVRFVDHDGREGELRAALTIGADGRRSTVAGLAGAAVPYKGRTSGRACFFAYWRDGQDEQRHVAAQWREGEELAAAFPCDDGLVLVLLQTPVARTAEFRADLRGTYERTVAAIPGLARRLQGCEPVSKVRAATDIQSYFRRASGPGWALAGDAAHFKDPVTAQGIRDGLRYARLLAEAAAPVLDDAAALDRTASAWERRLACECIEVYQWTDRLARGDAMTPLEAELYRQAAADPSLATALLDVFSRLNSPSEFLSPARAAALAGRALARPAGDRRRVLASAGAELRTALADLRERRAVHERG